jgi:shikimate kinase
MAEHLVLVGMMGSGKTTVGRLVARRLGRRFVDVDDEVAGAAGAPVPELIARDGVEAFRALESACLARCLAEAQDSVVAVGGGAVLDPANRAAMGAGATVVWLRARPATLAARVGDGAGRPLLAGGDVLGRLTALADERAALYEETAGAFVDTDGVSPEEVADALCRLVGTSA